jgi:DNA end-binding protein Ku
LVAHTLNEQRDINDAQQLFEASRHVPIDPEMVQLAEQLISRQTAVYDPSDLEDRYETRMRAMLEAKIKGQGVVAEGAPVVVDSNVVDLMAALRASLKGAAAGGPPPATEAAPAGAKPKTKRPKTEPSPDEVRRQPGLKFPIAGGKKADKRAAAPSEPAAAPAARPRRRA